jgi:hypothetical protein
VKPSNPTEWYRSCVVEALERRAADHEALAVTTKRPDWQIWRRERADECRKIARLLRNEDLPGCESEDHP